MGKRLWLCILVMLMFLTAQVTPAWCEDTSGSGTTQDPSSVVTPLDNTSGNATVTGGDGDQTKPLVSKSSDSGESTIATLHVITQVTNSNKGTKTASNFIVHVTASGSEISGSHQAAGSESGTSYTLDPGNYTISEETQDGYTFSFSGDSDDSGKITLAAGDDKTVTINNQDQAASPTGSSDPKVTTATLHVITHVINTNEGTKTASDFIVHVTTSGSEVSGSHQAAGSESGTSYILDQGDYTISEDVQAGYTFSFSGDSDDKGKISLAAGEDKTVTISNHDEESLKVMKLGILSLGLTPGDLQVQSTEPLDGAKDVATGPSQIKITFNQPICNLVYPDLDTYNRFFFISGKYNYGIGCTGVSTSADNCTLILEATLPEDDTISVTIMDGAIGKYSDHMATLPRFEFSFTTRSDTAINVPDTVLNQAIRDKLGIPSDRDIHAHEDGAKDSALQPIKAMDDLTEFTYPYLFSQYFDPMIKNISGLEYAVNLKKLHLENSEIADLSPLKGLALLQEIEVAGNQLGTADLSPLATLPQLTKLALEGCNISSISSLHGISTLKTLVLYNNSITNIDALDNLTGLNYLDLNGNSITNINALGNLTGLAYLDLSSNPITDLTPLGSLSGLEHLGLGNTGASGIGFLSGLTSLKELGLSNNNIANLEPLQGLTSLQFLDLSDNLISDPEPLQGLSSLQNLNLGKNCITDLNPILHFTWLNQLHEIDLTDNADLRMADYVAFLDAVEPLNVSIAGQRRMYNALPDNSTPVNEALSVDKNNLIHIFTYEGGNNKIIQRLKLGNYLSKMKVYVNGVYDDQLTKSLSWDDSSTGDELIFNHAPFPDASTVSIVAPPRLHWRTIQS
ncbi:MAG TPA: leucine-rich repeat domain-containing protein [Syntrophomonadaceae bacterium]|nr:leucine-rich repeat domain-containing protein [Syntrophomonadaceae bacterium]